MHVIYVEGDSTSPFFSAEASLCPREAGEREKSARGMMEGEREAPAFPASSQRPSRIHSGSLALWRREPRHVFSIHEKVFHAHHFIMLFSFQFSSQEIQNRHCSLL